MNAALGCIECDWHCWVHSSYGTTEPPGDEWEAVQACDECSPLMPDWRAALIAADHYGTRHLWVEPASDGRLRRRWPAARGVVGPDKEGDVTMCERCVIEQTGGNIPPITDEMRTLAGKAWDWYRLAGNDTGGVLHVLLDDYNTDDRVLDYCEEQLGWMWSDDGKVDADQEHRQLGAEIIAGFRVLTIPERVVVVHEANVYSEVRPR